MSSTLSSDFVPPTQFEEYLISFASTLSFAALTAFKYGPFVLLIPSLGLFLWSGISRLIKGSPTRPYDFDDGPVQADSKKSLYRRSRDEFRRNRVAERELNAWKEKNVDLDFVELNGLIPASLVGEPSSDGNGKCWDKCDTFFSEFEEHHPRSRILSETASSIIVANHSTHTYLQYPRWLDSKYAPRVNTPEGQGFGHILVIPKPRIFNIVDAEAVANNCAVIKELKSHFENFWSQHKHRIALVKQMHDLFASQNAVLRARARELGPDHVAECDSLVKHLDAQWRLLQTQFVLLEPGRRGGDFVQGFHPWRMNSVGHLHLHVFPRNGGFRTESAVRHDAKTIPFEDVLAVEQEGPRDDGGNEPVDVSQRVRNVQPTGLAGREGLTARR